MKYRILIRPLFLLVLLLTLVSISGVYATWVYTYETVGEAKGPVGVTVSEFLWDSEEILPDDGAIGESHLELLEQVCNNQKNGLNSSKDALFVAVKRNVILHSDQNIQGGNIKHLFITEESRALDFVLYYISDTQLELYTYEDYDISSGTVDKTEILVYKTIIQYKNDKWEPEGTMIGHAIIRDLNSQGTLSINPEEWEPGKQNM